MWSAVDAAPPTTSLAPASEDPEAVERRVDQAIEAWRQGHWTEVRDLLEPLLRADDGGINDPRLREQALRYLTEATLYDAGLEAREAEILARGYIERLLEAQSDWAPPSGLHGRPFYDLAAEVRAEHDAEAASACQGRLLTCEADLRQLQVDHRNARARYDDLQADYNAQNVQRIQVRERNRGLALLPLGVGHFTDKRYALGGLFLGLEVAAGAAGLGLLLYRQTVHGCTRTAGFQPRSLVCSVDVTNEDVPKLQDEIERNRNAELAMGYVIIGLVVADITVSQVLFRRFEFVKLDEVPRSELDADQPAPEGLAVPSTTSTPEVSARLRIRPSPVILPGRGGLPGGGGLGLNIEF